MNALSPARATVPATAPATAPVNALSVDVEDYFQVQAFADVIPRARWESIPRRVDANMDRILAQFARHRTRATFFTLGWIAERHPALVRRIVAEGHELASHGFDHLLADRMAEAAFRADVGRTRKLLEDVGGTPVIGYRAPTFSINRRNPWAFAALQAEGYRYSSSVFPVRHDLYGVPDAPRGPYRPEGTTLWELPMTTVRLLGRNLPCSGGGYFRLMPYALYRAGLRRVNAREGRPGIFYFHPWEIDPEQPVVAGADWRARFRHRVHLRRMSARIERLLSDFAWDRMDQVYAALLAQPRR